MIIKNQIYSDGEKFLSDNKSLRVLGKVFRVLVVVEEPRHQDLAVGFLGSVALAKQL